MKDLTDYFSSPSKSLQTSSSGAKDKPSKLTAEENKIMKNNSADVKTVKKKKKKRNPSDPAVKNVADLLSSSLVIVSPNASCSNQSKPKAMEKTKEVDQEECVLIVERDESNSCILQKYETQNDTSDLILDKENGCSKFKSKVNAFQFLMESRNKSIGQNSPGKDQPVEDCKVDDDKDLKGVLSARKNILQNWADKKGGIKRKRDEEEKDEVIKHKLQKRKKRLKKLLQVDCPKPKDADNNVIKKSKRRIKTISTSSSDNTRESVVLLENPNNVIVNPKIDIIEENAQDKVLNQSKTKDTKQGLLTFFGVVNKTKKTEDRQVEDTKDVKIKFSASKSKKKKVKAKSHPQEAVDTIAIKEKIVVKKTKLKKRKKKAVNKESDNHVLVKTVTPKAPKQRTDDEDSNFTPRSQKSWKMRIKISEEVGNEEESQQKRPQRTKRDTGYKLLLLDESSSEGDVTVFQRKGQKKVSKEPDVICLEDESCNRKKDVKAVKVAPVFAKASPKPKIPPEIIEARKQFLMSGIPDSLKRTIEKQQSVEEREYDVFPSISHVQQRNESQTFWTLPKPQLNLIDYSPLKVEKPVCFNRLTNTHLTSTINIQKEVEKVDKLKTLLNKIKSDNPNYPVYKSFRLICEKSGKALTNQSVITTKRKKDKKRRNKSVDRSIEIIEDVKPEKDYMEYAMWTEKYKPKCSDDIIGNSEGVKNLKKWLELWKNFSEEINARKKKKMEERGSDSDFDTTDCDSRDSTKLPGNTVIVGGPCGSGKSTAIYAICNELGFNVIELNASSKRTGKRLLQELQEATQSHQVRKKEHMQNFLQSKEKVEPKERRDKKMCVLLVEDVDVVFEQDDGFISALSQLVSTSKRPVVLTTTDTSPMFVQKFISQHEFISFLPLSSQSLATWLQIVCLVEGLLVNQGDIGSLLEFNKGDVRKTLLQLQFWVQFGGQIVRDGLPIKTKATVVNLEKKLPDDEQEPSLQDGSDEAREVFVHSNCIGSFEILRHHKVYRVPYYLNLGFLWWNIPNILSIQRFSEERINRFKESFDTDEDKKEEIVTTRQNRKLSPTEKQRLESLSKFYDSLVFTDVSFKNFNYFDGLEPAVRNYNSEVRDSLELGEAMDSCNEHIDFVHEITHSLVNGYIEEYNGNKKSETVLNITVPEKSERRWRAKMHVCEDVFLEAVPLSTYIERRAVALDYMPYLRDISRSECCRAANNTKRGNRFRNYLRSVGINYNDNTLKLACNILTLRDP